MKYYLQLQIPMIDTNDDIGSIEIGQCILDANSDNMITFTGEINFDHVHCGINTTSANNLAGNDPVIYSNVRDGDTVGASGHSSSSRTSVAEFHVTCNNTTSSTLSSQKCSPVLPTTTQSSKPMSNEVGMPSIGTVQPKCSDELESTPVIIRGDHHMTNANTNSTSEVSEITNGTSVSSSQYTTKPDKAGSTDVLTQTDNAQVSNDSNSSHDFLSTSISVSSQSSQSASSTVELTLSDSLEKH